MAGVGDRVKITTNDQEHEGTLLPDDGDFLVLKLDSGYNLGISKARKPTIQVIAHAPARKPLTQTTTSTGGQMAAAAKHPIISILHTGGTIASKVDYETGAVVARYSPEELLAQFPELKEIATIRSRLLSNMFSEDMRFAHHNIIAKETAKEINAGADGVIVTHGTDTLHYTAAALHHILNDLGKPVILVGAQRSSDRPSSDAAQNLIAAATFIAKTNWAGVAICMHENTDDDTCTILPGDRTRKLHTSRRDAFKPVNAEAIARITLHPEGIQQLQKTATHRHDRQPVLKLINETVKVALVKTHPNFSAKQLKCLEGYDGIVIEGTGLGHIPINEIDYLTAENSRILDAARTLANNGTIIAMTSQCVYGETNQNVYSTGRKQQEAGIIPARHDLPPETAFIRLAWLLSHHEKKDVLKLFAPQDDHHKTTA